MQVASSSVLKIKLSKCSFENEIHCTKAFDDFIIFGMTNSIGVVSLKHKNEAIYTLRPDKFEDTKQLIVITKIITLG